MTEYINKKEAEKLLCAHCDASPCPFDCPSITALKEKPSITIVRCKDCKYAEYNSEDEGYECRSSGDPYVYEADYFCADGREKTDGD